MLLFAAPLACSWFCLRRLETYASGATYMVCREIAARFDSAHSIDQHCIHAHIRYIATLFASRR
jgi:hypothetical protein